MNHVKPTASTRENWLEILGHSGMDIHQLCERLSLPTGALEAAVSIGVSPWRHFPMRVPAPFLQRIKKGDIRDPLLLQILQTSVEARQSPFFSKDPLGEASLGTSGILKKYHGRALWMLKGSCAIHCRYCFRRHFPYENHPSTRTGWQLALGQLAADTTLSEVILSGGDPLMARDREWVWIFDKLSKIPHIQRVRIHTRLPIVIPQRITTELCAVLSHARFAVVVVTHCNHANEIDEAVVAAMALLKAAGVTLLNQAVLLKGVNDSACALVALSEGLFRAHILPYYLHLLDRVAGAAHFEVNEQQARRLMHTVIKQLPGYLVPRLVRERGGEYSKSLIDLKLALAENE